MPVALRELKDVMGRKRAFIVTDTESYKSGRTAPVERLLDCINIQHTSFYEIDGEVTLCNIQSGAKAAALFEPDVIIAVGGGSAMDGAKLIRIMYEVPDTDIKALSERFCDIRKREELFPRTNVKAALVTVPAASGTGEEVTPYAAFYDDEKRYVIADYEVMPEFAVVDPDFMITQTREEIAAAASAAKTVCGNAAAAGPLVRYSAALSTAARIFLLFMSVSSYSPARTFHAIESLTNRILSGVRFIFDPGQIVTPGSTTAGAR